MAALDDLRAAVRKLSRAAIRLPDSVMDAPYAWGDYDEEGLRFALLTAYHQLIDVAFALESGRTPLTQAERILGGFIEAHADLASILESASDEELDLEPAPAEWPLRKVAAHVLEAEHGFSFACGRGLASMAEGSAPTPITDWSAVGRPPRAEGDREAVVTALAASRDRVLAAFLALTDAQLDSPAYFWESEPLRLRFRLIRFELHLRQHIVQADKTMAGIGHPPTEAERLARLVRRGLASVEAALLGAPNRYGEVQLRDVGGEVSAHRTAIAGSVPAT